MQLERLFLEDLEPGRSAEAEQIFSAAEVDAYAALTGDYNPVHMDEKFATESLFGARIVHGLLVAGLFSRIIGTQLPGAHAIYEGQTLAFRRPVRLGERVTARCTVIDRSLPRRRATLACECRVEGRIVVDGEARVLAPLRADNLADPARAVSEAAWRGSP